MSIVDTYFDTLRTQLERLRTTQRPALGRAAALLADSLQRGGVVHLFGTGHSHMIAEEVFYRAGGLIPINAMLDASVVLSGSALGSTETERRSGAAAEIAARYDLHSDDVGVIISNSGRNPAPVEMARLMKTRGMGVVAITSIAHSTTLPILTPPGARLLEVADVTLDTGAVFGDACLQLPGVRHRVGPTSTILGASLVQALILETMEQLLAAGRDIINLPSGNVPEVDLAPVFAEIGKYRKRLRHL